MDFHPLVIHYPIAFLTTYAVCELLRFRKLLNLPHWFYIKAVLVIVGELGAIVTVIAAEMSTALAVGNMLVDKYKLFILLSTIIFGIIAFSYLFEWFRPNRWSLLAMRPVIIYPLAIVGLFLIVVAGGLFGATVYGTQFDPFMAPIFKLLNVY